MIGIVSKEQGCGSDTFRDDPPFYGRFVFEKPLLLYHRSGHFPEPWPGVLGNVSEIKISWTSPWDITFSDGSVASVQRPGCETVGSENFLCADGDRCDAGDFFLDLDANASASLRSRGDLTGSTFKGYTVSVCLGQRWYHTLPLTKMGPLLNLSPTDDLC